MILTIDHFAEALQSWSQQVGDQFHFFYPLQGGWEAWVQASLAAFIIDIDHLVDIQREVRIFEGQQRVDWLVNGSSEDPSQRLAIELKCQSFSSEASFVPGLESDAAKLDQSNLAPEYRGAVTAVVGIGFTQHAYNFMTESGFAIPYQSSDAAVGLYVIDAPTRRMLRPLELRDQDPQPGARR